MTAALLTPAATDSTTDVDTVAEFARIVDELTRRGFLAGGLGSAALLGMAACGSSGPAAPSASPAANRTISTVKGDVVVSGQPSRVVTITPFAAETLVDLGLTPVGQSARPQAGSSLPTYVSALAQVPEVGVVPLDSVEKIAALKPDLIITFAGDPALTRLQAVAPTIGQDASAAWQDLDSQVADALGRTAQFTALTRRYEDRLHALAVTYGTELQQHRWYAIGVNSSTEWDLYYSATWVGQILSELHATMGGLAVGDHKPGADHPYSMEELDGLSDADVILLYDYGADAAPSANARALFNQPLWQRLPAVKAGQVFRSLAFAPASYSDADACLDQIEAACRQLKAAK